MDKEETAIVMYDSHTAKLERLHRTCSFFVQTNLGNDQHFSKKPKCKTSSSHWCTLKEQIALGVVKAITIKYAENSNEWNQETHLWVFY